jgi:inosine-uridine nucleoside N-ribohydrolase
LKYPGINCKRFVAKNVCHKVYYDRHLHEIIGAIKCKNKGLLYIWKGMDAYLQKKSAGKKLHDPLAACCAIDESIGVWAEVELYRERGQWGAKLSPGSGVWIIVDYDREKFIQTLTAY